MNKKQQILNTNKIYRSYHIPGQSHIHPLKKNAIFVSNANTIKHELSKCLGAIMLKRYGDIKFDKFLVNMIKNIEIYIGEIYKGWPKNEADFITEASPNKEKNRRVDLVNINTDDRYEFETNKAIRKDNCITIYI